MDAVIERWLPNEPNDRISAFLERPAFDPKAEVAAEKILADVRNAGDEAVFRYAAKFDGATLDATCIRVSRDELTGARDQVDPEFRAAVREACERVAAFARSGMKQNWQMSSPRGGTLGEQFVPLDRVGVYVPGGTAPLASTAIMTAVLARVAGVQQIVACTPCGANGAANPFLLHALEASGANEVYRVGGVQAIGMMAYGTETVAKVQKIVGPGNAYVTSAKRRVYGEVALDLVAGPSEIAVLADADASAPFVAADLLSQIEHGTGQEKALLVTPSAKLAEAVRSALREQVVTLSRRELIEPMLAESVLLVVVNHLDDGMDLCNRFAPEHLELMVSGAQNWLKKVRHAGAVFVGAWSPESAGDFVAGPSHVLPTGGAAAMFSGLTVDDFRKRSSFIAFTRADLQDALPVIEAFGRVEGLDAHVRSAQLRFEKR